MVPCSRIVSVPCNEWRYPTWRGALEGLLRTTVMLELLPRLPCPPFIIGHTTAQALDMSDGYSNHHTAAPIPIPSQNRYSCATALFCNYNWQMKPNVYQSWSRDSYQGPLSLGELSVSRYSHNNKEPWINSFSSPKGKQNNMI